MAGSSDRSRRVDPKGDAAAKQPPPEHVNDFHTNSDVDSGPDAHHHRLGQGPNQAAPGTHIHDGTDSPLILGGLTITGAKPVGSQLTWAQSVNALLVRLGAADQSS